MDDGSTSTGIDRRPSPLTPATDRAGRRSAARGAPLRVLHLVSSLAVGGMEQFVLRLAREQRSAGHDAAVLSIREGPLVEQARCDGIPVRVLGGRRKLARIARGIAHMARMRPNILHVHNPPSLPYGLLGRACCRARLVMTHHGQMEMDLLSTAAQRRIDVLVAVSDAVRDALRSLGMADRRGSVTVLRNGVQTLTPGRTAPEVSACRLGRRRGGPGSR